MANRDLRPESVQATPNIIPFPERPKRAAAWPHDLPPFDPANPAHVRAWRNLYEMGRAELEAEADRSIRAVPTIEAVLSESHRNRIERIVAHLLAMLDASDRAHGTEDDDPLEANGDELDYQWQGGPHTDVSRMVHGSTTPDAWQVGSVDDAEEDDG
jgi:hypothetical protein